MNISIPRPALARTVLFALGCAFSVALTPALHAENKAAAEKAPLPMSTSFDKTMGGEKGPYVLTLKNDSKETLKVHAKVLLSVAMHADNKARHVPAEKVAPGGTMKIADLAAGDKVVVTAKGFAPLHVEVPSDK